MGPGVPSLDVLLTPILLRRVRNSGLLFSDPALLAGP